VASVTFALSTAILSIIMPHRMAPFIRWIGNPLLQLTNYLGELAVLTGEIWHSLIRSRIRWRIVARQIVTIGFGSQLQVIVTGAFTGAVFAAQVYYKFNQLGFESVVGGVVALAMARELGPVLTALMLTGRVGAAMAAEIGTMKVTEQVDALRSLGVHPVDFLVSPRFLAMIFSVPLLIGESIRFGMGAARLLTVGMYDVPEAFYQDQLSKNFQLDDIWFGMTKGLVFGYIIVLVCCHQGLNVKQGAVGVGRGTTAAVVIACLAVLIINFFLTLALNFVWPVAKT
jgi:phospholipid/cholesterol/gamma-HCH transport system permease protein